MWSCLLVEGWVVAWPARAPCPASPYRLRRSVLRHCIGVGCVVVGVLLAGGRGCGRWRVLHGCSRLWAWLLAENWVVVRVVLVVAPLDFNSVRACSMSWTCSVVGVWVDSLVASAVDGLGFDGVRACLMSRTCSVAVVWVVLVAVAGVDGVFHKSVRGYGRACWPRIGSCCWSWLVSMVRDICVFEHVRGCG